MRYYIAKSELIKSKVRLFPFREFYRDGKWRKFGAPEARQMLAIFEAGLPNSRLPVNIEHNPYAGRIGTYKRIWVGEDGIYGQIEWTDIGRQYVKEDRFLFFSPEIKWEWTDPKTAKNYENVLVGGAVTNYPFHGDDTLLFSNMAQEYFDALHKIGVLSINPRTVQNVSDKELLSLHHRMHQLSGSLRKGAPTAEDVHVPAIADEVKKTSTEDVVNAHIILVHEMGKRKLKHVAHDWLDQQSKRLMKSTASDVVRKIAEAESQEVMLIPGFASIVGSAVDNREPGDLDILIRAEKSDNFYQINEQSLWLPLRKLIDPYKDGTMPLRWVSGAQGPHDDALVFGDLVLKIRPRFQPVEKAYEIEKAVRSYIYFVGTGALGSRRRTASLMVVSGRSAVLFDSGEAIKPKHLPRVPDVIMLTDPTENMKEARRLGEQIGVEVIHGKWEGPDIQVEGFKVEHTGHDVYGYLIEMSDVRIAYVPEFWKFPSEVADVDVGIFDGSAFDKPIPFAGGKGGHAAVTDILVDATRANVKRIVFTHVGKTTDQHLGLLQAGGIEVAMDGQSLILKAAVEPGRQNFKPLKTGRGYGQNEFADPDIAWEVWGRENTPFTVEQKYDGWRIMAHKRGDLVRLFSEDAKQDLSEKVPGIAKAIAGLPDDFILDGELEIYAKEPVAANFRYEAGEKIERIDMPSFLAADKPKGEYAARYFVFDMVYRDGDLHRLPWTERRKALDSLVGPRQTDTLKLTPTTVVDNKRQFLDAAREAFRRSDSEGAMLKRIAAPYPLNGETIEWAKLKAFKEMRVRIVRKKKGGRGAWIYTVALSDGSIIGNTYATGVDAGVGEVLEMRVAEVKVKQEEDRKIFRWDNPIVHSKKPKDTTITTPAQAEELARLRRGQKTDFGGLLAAMEWEASWDEEVDPLYDIETMIEEVLGTFTRWPISKPYGSNSELPAAVRNVLPSKAQTIFRRAFNGALKNLPEQRAFKVAWGAVKNAGYRKGTDGKWTS